VAGTIQWAEAWIRLPTRPDAPRPEAPSRRLGRGGLRSDPRLPSRRRGSGRRWPIVDPRARRGTRRRTRPGRPRHGCSERHDRRRGPDRDALILGFPRGVHSGGVPQRDRCCSPITPRAPALGSTDDGAIWAMCVDRADYPPHQPYLPSGAERSVKPPRVPRRASVGASDATWSWRRWGAAGGGKPPDNR